MSRTVTIPGGTAELFDRNELTPRRTIPYQILLNRADELMSKLAAARKGSRTVASAAPMTLPGIRREMPSMRRAV